MRYNAPAEGHAIAMLSYLANPARFMRISGVALPWLGASSLAVLALGLVWSLLLAPPDYQQGESVRIMFIHVPAAWMALSVYLFVAIASAVGSDRRRLHADLPGDGFPVGPADVGRLVGVGRAADLGAGAVLPVSRLYRAGERV